MKKKNHPVLLFIFVLCSVLLLGGLCMVYYARLQREKTDSEMAENENTAMQEGVSDGAKKRPETGSDKAGMRADGQQEALLSGITDADARQSGEEEEAASLSEIETDVQPAGGQVVMTFTGDICFHDPFANMGAYRQRGGDIGKCIDDTLLTEMRDSDICMINNEFPYSFGGVPLADKAYTFRSRPENVKILTDMGVDIAGIANNHAFDYGEEAFLDTLDVLRAEGIQYAGGGRNLAEASAPVIVEKSGMKLGFLAATQIERTYSPDTRGATESRAGVMRSFTPDEYERFLESVRQADGQCDFLTVFIHWGDENTDVLDAYQTDQAAGFIGAGADLVVGAHPHCLQGLGQVDGVPVIYSLGNYWFNSKTVDTALLKVVVEDGKLLSVQMIPALQHDCRTDHLEGADRQRIIDYLNSISRDGVSLDAEGYLTWQETAENP